MTTLPLLGKEPADLQLGQMRARGLRRDAGLAGQFARGQRPAGQQRGQHVGARRIADQRSNHGDIGTRFHCSVLTEAFMSDKRLLWDR